ncbi:MAG: FHA domain-containing protein [Planctomycetota bacterium]
MITQPEFSEHPTVPDSVEDLPKTIRRERKPEPGSPGPGPKPRQMFEDLFQKMITREEGPTKYGLVCFPLDPVPLETERVVTIGRARTNDLILPVGMVSREHAQISWNGEAFQIKDLGSSNGTFVNEKEVKEAVLKDGDAVKIGPYNLTFRAYQGSIDDLKGGGEALDVTQNITRRDLMEKSSTFSGTLGEMRMDEVLQLIDFNKKTGTLLVKSGDKRGKFHFKEGQILAGEFHTSKGEGAVVRVLSLRTGDFSFQAGEPDIEQTIFEGTAKVLLNAMRRLDELDR